MAMVKDVYYGKTLRKSFQKHDEIQKMPNMLQIQRASYDTFLETGLQEVFKDVGTITDYTGNLELSFLDYTMRDEVKYTVDECRERDATYSKPIYVRVLLRNKETGVIKEQEIFMGDFPLMTEGGTFVINGAERVIVSQIVRSPGMYYGDTADKADNHVYTATVIPYRGAWLEYETDLSKGFYVRIDKNRKLPITCLIRAMGVETDAQITEMFGEDPFLQATMEKDACKTKDESLLEIYKKLRPGEPPTVENAQSYLDSLFFDARRYDVSRVGRYKFTKKLQLARRLAGQVLAQPIADPLTGEILAMPGDRISKEQAEMIQRKGVNEATVLIDDREVRIFSNHMVDMSAFVDFDPKEVGILEWADFRVLQELMENYSGDELMEACRSGPPIWCPSISPRRTSWPPSTIC